jgi:hypothetical protein
MKAANFRAPDEEVDLLVPDDSVPEEVDGTAPG